MKRPGIFWLVHWIATVTGWYTLSALAQGVADSAAAAPLPLVAFEAVVQVLCMPVVTGALALVPLRIGGFDPASFAAFTLLAALNSAVVAAVIALALRALRRVPGPGN